MGAEFLELDFKRGSGQRRRLCQVMSEAFIKAEMALFAAQAKDVDIIVTTALIPGKPAPKLITREMVDSTKSGSVVVDLALQNGGNWCRPHRAGPGGYHRQRREDYRLYRSSRSSADELLTAVWHQPA
ncbi:hypothetical protein ACNKHR_26670 [Shigella flexneri]